MAISVADVLTEQNDEGVVAGRHKSVALVGQGQTQR